MSLPPRFEAYLDVPSLRELWSKLRDRLERSGHAIRGSIRADLDTDAAERMSGLLGRHLSAGRRTLSLSELDTALLRSAAGQGLVPVLAELTGGPLRDRPSERLARREAVSALWSDVEKILHDRGLSTAPWVRGWTQWLHDTGLLVRSADTARAEFDTAAHAVSVALTQPSESPRMLGQLATTVAGDSHALDNDRLAGRLALRALAFALDRPEPSNPRDRIALWQSTGITVDTVSGTVLTWGLRPPGEDRWSEMMRMRADLGLVTHLTLTELTTFTAPLTDPGATIAACENPQVLQRAAEAGTQQPLLCFSGNPSSAGLAVAERVRIRYHGDFDWPGIAIAARLHAGGADLWRMTTQDYLRATTSDGTRLPLTGAPIPTPWEPELSPAMIRVGMVVHEEAVLDDLLADLL
ncbi:TIGR02679 family protein [Nocardia abscessus]|uniref:TIGR02679 family protein n=1 Tax=Nocardia abscessus TaxID=120957 RepID=A0ABS0C8M3_9NOCA|nr:TIGR02679 family protein [Nocardia abscessus]MBF6225872.1 TIGR02679 family protein [Nocardia abscessus]